MSVINKWGNILARRRLLDYIKDAGDEGFLIHHCDAATLNDLIALGRVRLFAKRVFVSHK